MSALQRAMSLLAVLAPLAACNLPPPSPEDEAAYHRFQTGCRPQDANGYENQKEYCGNGGGGGNRGGGR